MNTLSLEGSVPWGQLMQLSGVLLVGAVAICHLHSVCLSGLLLRRE